MNTVQQQQQQTDYVAIGKAQAQIAQTDVQLVQVEEVAVMRLLKHARESREAQLVAQQGRQSYAQNQVLEEEEQKIWTIGQLLGYYHDVGAQKGLLEITNSYPILLTARMEYPPEEPLAREERWQRQGQEEQRYEEDMSKRIQEVFLDNNHVGIYHISYKSNNITKKEVNCMLEHLDKLIQRNPATVYLVYDLQAHLSGAAQPLQAFQLSKSIRALLEKERLTPEDQARNSNVQLLRQVPLEIKFSPVAELFLKVNREALTRPYQPTLLNPNRSTGSGQQQSAVSAAGPARGAAARAAAAARHSKAAAAANQDDGKLSAANIDVFDFYELKSKNYTLLDQALKQHQEASQFKFEEQQQAEQNQAAGEQAQQAVQQSEKPFIESLKTSVRVDEIAKRLEYLGEFVQQCDALAEQLTQISIRDKQ